MMASGLVETVGEGSEGSGSGKMLKRMRWGG